MTRGERRDVLTFQTHTRTWIQLRENPDSPIELLKFGALGGLAEPRGAGTPVHRYSTTERRAYDKVGESIAAPDTYTTSFQEGLKRATANYLQKVRKAKKDFALHVLIHQDADPEDPTKWESKVVVAGNRLTNFTTQPFQAFDADAEVYCEGELEYDSSVWAYPIAFGEVAETEIAKEVVDTAVYPPDDRDVDYAEKEIYHLTKVDTTAPYVVWSHDGGQTWTATALTDLSTNEPDAIAIVGNYLIVVSSADESYLYANRSDPTTWTRVTSGFQSTKGPTAIWASSLANIFMVGLGGYIYKLTLPGQAVTVLNAGVATTQNLNAIHGRGDTIVAVGASNAVVFSQNGGGTWSSLTGPAAATALNCVCVKNHDHWWIGADGAYYTVDEGANWQTKALGDALLATVNDIQFSADSDAVGYLAYTTSTPTGHVQRTTDFGREWEDYSIDVVPPTNEAINSIAIGGPNYVVVGGLETAAGADGIAAIGSN